MYIITNKISVGCCTLTTPILYIQTKGVVVGQHPTKDIERSINATSK